MSSGYQKILVAVDNSAHAGWGVELGIGLARRFGARLVGSHVYTAGLHDARFRQMERDLPGRYQEEGELQRQREVHDSLIARGLELISHSYLDACEQRCHQAEVAFARKVIEGKNYAGLVRDIQAAGYDLGILGYQGLGAMESSFIGSVCERVVRRVRTDVLVVKSPLPLGEKVLVALDGSPQALAGLRAALGLAKAFGARVDAVSVYDPHFHQVAFRSIAGVLSEEAGNLFRFREQERLHEEIIDRGLARIYHGHLEEAARIARQEGVEIATTLLAGKPFPQILRHLEATRPSLLVVGRVGVHCTDGLDIGATTENLLRQAPCHLWIAAGACPGPRSGEGRPPAPELRGGQVGVLTNKTPSNSPLERGRARASYQVSPLYEGGAGGGCPPLKAPEAGLRWTEEAARELERVPAGFIREAARARYEAGARARGQELVTPDLIAEQRGRWSQGGEPVEQRMAWTEEAKEKLGRAPAFIRAAIVRAVEDLARKHGALEVTAELIEEAKDQWKQGMPFSGSREE